MSSVVLISNAHNAFIISNSQDNSYHKMLNMLLQYQCGTIKKSTGPSFEKENFLRKQLSFVRILQLILLSPLVFCIEFFYPVFHTLP